MRKTLLFAIVAVFVSVVAVQGKKNGNDAHLEYQRKADYIFLQSQAMSDSVGDYFYLLRAALDVNPTDSFINRELGYFYMMLAERESRFDSATLIKGYQMLKDNFDPSKVDLYEALRFASFCTHFGFTDESIDIMRQLAANYPKKPEVQFNLAELLFQQADTASMKEALDIYKRLERTEGVSLGLSSQKIRAYMALHDTTGIIDEIKSIDMRPATNGDNQVYIGNVYMALQQPDSALKFYNKALAIDSTNGLAYHQLAEYYISMNDSAAYDREVFNALSNGNLEVGEKIELMRGYVQNLYGDENQRPRIERLFEVLTALHPHEPDIRDLYSVYLAVIGNYEQSAEQTALFLDLEPSEITSWNRLISLYLTLDSSQKAVDAAQRAMHFFPHDVNLKLLASSAYTLNEKTDTAIMLLQQALEAADTLDVELLSQIETSLGDAYYREGQHDTAFGHYDKALKHNPHNLMAMNNAAYFMACENIDLPRALSMSLMTVVDEPANPIYLDTYAWVLFKMKKFEEAKEYIDKTLEADSEPSAELYEHAGDIYFMNLMPAQALDFWRQALELDPDNELLRKKVTEKTYLTE